MAPIENEDPTIWAKYPWQKSVIVCLSAIVFLFGIIMNNTRIERNRLQKLVETGNTTMQAKDEEIKSLSKSIIDCNRGTADYFKKMDSTNRAVLDLPARQLLKQLNK
jgi:hypothetical protein